MLIKNAKSAFTLIELLVVISIVAVLLALIMPALANARETAMRAKCAANLRQFVISVTSYDSTYKAYPNAYDTRGNGFSEWLGGKPGYVTLRDEYGLAEAIVNCPSQIQKPIMTRSSGTDYRQDDNTVQYIGYFYFAGHGGRAAPVAPGTPPSSLVNTFNGWTQGNWPAKLKGFVPATNSYGGLCKSAPGETTQRQILTPARQFLANDYGYSASYVPNVRVAQQSSHLNKDGKTCAGINIAYQDGHVAWTPYISGKSWWVTSNVLTGGNNWLFYNEDDRPVECSFVN